MIALTIDPGELAAVSGAIIAAAGAVFAWMKKLASDARRDKNEEANSKH